MRFGVQASAFCSAVETSAPPATADVEQAISRLEAQIAAGHVELVVLRSRQIVVPSAEIGAAVDHLGIKNQRVERIGKIVVVVDVFLVCFLSVDPFVRRWPSSQANLSKVFQLPPDLQCFSRPYRVVGVLTRQRLRGARSAPAQRPAAAGRPGAAPGRSLAPDRPPGPAVPGHGRGRPWS